MYNSILKQGFGTPANADTATKTYSVCYDAPLEGMETTVVTESLREEGSGAAECQQLRPWTTIANDWLKLIRLWNPSVNIAEMRRPAKPLPVEMIFEILGYMPDDDKKLMYECININRSWKLAAFAKLWKSLNVEDDNVWKALLRLCSNQPVELRFGATVCFGPQYLQRLCVGQLEAPITADNCDLLLDCCPLLQDLSFYRLSLVGGSTRGCNYMKSAHKKLMCLTSLSIADSPQVDHILFDAIIARIPNLQSLLLAGIYSISEVDLCQTLQHATKLLSVQLGNLTSVRSPFSSTMGFSKYEGTLLAAALKKYCPLLKNIHMEGLLTLSTTALTSLLQIHSQDGEGRKIALHSGASLVGDGNLSLILTSNLTVSNLTSLSISEIHQLTDATFMRMIVIMGQSALEYLQIGPGLNLHEISVSSIGQFATKLKYFECRSLDKVKDISVFVGFPFATLKCLRLKSMRNLKETRKLKLAEDYSIPGWRKMIFSVVGKHDFELCDSADYFDAEDGLGPSQNQPFDFGFQVNAEDILVETAAASVGVTIFDPTVSVPIGCVSLETLEIRDCPMVDGALVNKLAVGMAGTLQRLELSQSQIDDSSRIDLLSVFPFATYT